MKRDIQVGVILGVIILAIIGVFLSTRTTMKEPPIPIPDLEENIPLEALNINTLTENLSGAAQTQEFSETTMIVSENSGHEKPQLAVTENIQKLIEEEKVGEGDDAVIEGEWTGAKEDEKKEIQVATNTRIQSLSQEQEKKETSTLLRQKPSEQRLEIYKVQHKDTLRKIAQKYYGDASQWMRIFDANEDKIYDRNSLQIGMELVIPMEKVTAMSTKKETTTPLLSHVVDVESKKPLEIHRIQRGDTLYKLAVKYYNDGNKWKNILEANKNVIKNKNVLLVGQEVVIPDL
ncbi:MAG: LysM peptidoglycan-binding domain-containing protein [Candidatus Brocadiaceae bacterium]|nr:LysM peptidoglycan-binding domain-containing protein [Candidatus Brocadiaceae bacterium]